MRAMHPASLGLGLLMALGACGGDEATPPADTSADVPDLPETPDGDVAEDLLEEVEPSDLSDVPDLDADPGDDVPDTFDPTERPAPGRFALGTAQLADQYVFKGVWAGAAGRVVAVGNDGVVATQRADGAWDILARTEGAALFNAVHGRSANQLWAVGSNAAILRGSADSFGGSSACEDDADCADGDSCTINTCVENVCQAASTGEAGCCGTTPGAWDFEQGVLAPWTVVAADRRGPWDWHVVSVPNRSASGSFSLYFGDSSASPPTYDAPGLRVSGTVVSPSVRIPSSGVATLSFRLFLDVEADAEYDYVAVEVLSDGVVSEVWHKRELDFVPTAGFVNVSVDLGQWLGRMVSIRVRFDSVDDSLNTFEGAYLDDIRIETACTGAGAVATSRGPTLWGIHALTSDFAVAVGQGGAIRQWNGTTWVTPTSASPSASWNAMAGRGQTIALVGNDGQAAFARGANFTSVNTGTTFSLHGVHMPEDNRFVAVGDGGVILSGTGSLWSRVQGVTTENLRDVHGVADALVAVGARGTIVAYDGRDWTTVSSGVTTNLFGVWRLASGEVIAVGRDGVVLEGNPEDGFSQTGQLSPGLDLLDLWATPDDALVVAVGQNGRIFTRQSGGDWIQVQSPTSQTFDTVWGSGPDDIWVVGRAGTIVHWDGQAWLRVDSPVSAALNGVWGDAPDRFFAAGTGGILLVWDGFEWTAATGGTTRNLRAVHMRSRLDGWAVGGFGTVLRYRGLGWANVPVVLGPEPDDLLEDELHAVWSFAADDAWAVGANGRIIHWDGQVWTDVETPWSVTLRGLYGRAPNDMWAVGNQGQVLHYNGEIWQRIETGSIATLYAIHGDGDRHVVVVGSLGTVLTLERD